MKSTFLFTCLLLIPFSTTSVTKADIKQENSIKYVEYNGLVKDIPSAQGLIDLNEKIDDLKVKVDSLKNK